jgi:hypothetical protein
MLGCGFTGAPLLLLAAMGSRESIFYDCGKEKDCVHVENEVGWYYSQNYSWGFVQANDSVYRDSCDKGRLRKQSFFVFMCLIVL